MYFRFRRSSNHVVGRTKDVSVPSGWVDAYFDVVEDPDTPDGVGCGKNREHSYEGAKFYDSGAGEVRAATAQEIATFADAEDADLVSHQRDAAKALLNDDPVMKKILSAMFKEIIAEIDNRVGIAPVSPTPRTLGQIAAAIYARIDSGSED